MGSYIQIGICTHLSVRRADFVALGLTRDEVVREITSDFLDLSVLIEEPGEEFLGWALPQELIEEGLIPFLRAQYALLWSHGTAKSEAILARITKAGTRERIHALAQQRSMADFKARTMPVALRVGPRRERLPMRAELLLYLVEGKAMLEEHQRLFRYIEALIHAQRAHFPIAAAVKVFLE